MIFVNKSSKTLKLNFFLFLFCSQPFWFDIWKKKMECLCNCRSAQKNSHLYMQWYDCAICFVTYFCYNEKEGKKKTVTRHKYNRFHQKLTNISNRNHKLSLSSRLHSFWRFSLKKKQHKNIYRHTNEVD